MKARLVLALVGASVVPAARARADMPTDKPTAVDVERWTATATGWWAGLDDARALGMGHLAIGATASVATRPIGLSSPGGDDLGAPVSARATLTLAAAYGVTETVDVNLALPLVLQGGDRLTAVGRPQELKGATSGDARLGVKVQLFANERVTAALAAGVTLPTGNEQHYAGEESWVADWRGLGIARLGRFAIGLGAGVRLRGAEVALSPSQVSGNELVGALAVAWQLPVIDGVYCDWTALRAIAELDGVYGDKVGGVRGPSPLEARVGVRGRVWRGWTIGVVGGRGLVDEVGAPRWRGVIEVSWRDEPRTDAPVRRDDAEPADEELEYDDVDAEGEVE
jgi:hypothetical protein